MRPSRIAYALLLLIAALLSLCLGSCTSSRLTAHGSEKAVSDYYKEHPEAQWPASKKAVPTPDITRTSPGHDVLPMSEVAKPGILSGIGRIFSTPEGAARRQAVKLAKAGVPRSIGKGAVYAPNASKVANSFKGTGNSTAADSGAAVNNAAENSQQQNVKGDNNSLTADKHDTTQQAKDWKAELASPTGKVLALTAAALLLYGLYYFWWVIPRRKQPIQPLSPDNGQPS